ncbi:MAG: PH domain-containing protein [Candidatus Methanofastidiosia archaeon]
MKFWLVNEIPQTHKTLNIIEPYQKKRYNMYCQRCGREIGKDVKFCPSCGTLVSTNFQVGESEEPLLILKPKFIPVVTALSILPLQIFFTLWGGMFFGGFGMFGVKALGLNLPLWFTFVFFGFLFFFGIPIIAYLAKKKTYAKTEYRFYHKKLDFYEGFFTVEEKTMNYRNITEINLRKGIFQRMYGLGTIILSTPATGIVRGTARSGILVSDIENSDEVYKMVKELVSGVS